MVQPRRFPHEVAVFSERLLFTSLDLKDVESARERHYTHPMTGVKVKLFTVDGLVSYVPFASDHGPLNLAMTHDALVVINQMVNEERYADRALCLYSGTDPKLKSNSALLIALYHLIIEQHPPWRAFSPLAKMEIMPFRDAGGLPADFNLSIQDITWGCWKATRLDLLSFSDFEPETYRYFEMVENGDFNWVTPHFIAFASPIDEDFINGKTHPLSTAHSTRPEALNKSFKNCLQYFVKYKVKVVIRLNDPLYDSREFTDREIAHVDMFFPDGTNPTDEMVRAFIELVEATVATGHRVAVHCKAGLGRTGALIGAYLIYKYGFTAHEVIGLMRLMRPGMVVGNQQHYLALNQIKWLGWAAVDEYRSSLAKSDLPVVRLPPVSPQREPIPTVPAEPKRITGDAVGQPRKHSTKVPELQVNLPRLSVSPAAPLPVTETVMRRETPSAKVLRSSSVPVVETSAPASRRHGSRPPQQERPTKRRPGPPLAEVDSALQIPVPMSRTPSDSGSSLGSKLRRLAGSSSSSDRKRERTPESPPRRVKSPLEPHTPINMATGSPGFLGSGMLKSLRKRASMTNVS